MWQKWQNRFASVSWIFWISWFGVWLLIMAIAAFHGDTDGAFRQITPKILAIATATRIAFSIKDASFSVFVKTMAILFIVVIEVTVCVMLDTSNEQPLKLVILQEFVNAVSMMGVAFALRYGMNTVRAKQVTHKAELQRKLAEQRALNARLTPHVLYNMLNTIYSVSLKEPNAAPELILALAGMMRHLTDSTDKDYVDAESELNFMRNYASLIRAQMNNVDGIQLNFPENVDTQIPNLLCVTLFENAVTHSKTLSNKAEIIANFIETESGFRFSVNNTYEQSTNVDDRTHTGIDSVKQRLEYLYPQRHTFTSHPVSDERYEAHIETW